MAPGFLGLLALASLAAASPDEFPDTAAMAGMHANCYSLLTGMGRSSYSEAELSMICRARLPMEVCRAAANELGEKPWSPATIGRTCGKWDEQWTERALLMTPEERQLYQKDWQAKINDVVKKKAYVGWECPQRQTGPDPVDQCTKYKNEEYPKLTAELNEVYKQKTEAWKKESNGAAVWYEVPGREAPAPSSLSVVSAVGAAALCAAGAAALVALTRKRRARSPLAEPVGDTDAELTQS
jgi:hypothetical protein